MGGLEGILLGLGGKALSGIIAKRFGTEMGDLAKEAMVVLGQAFGVDPEPAAIEKRITEVQASDPKAAQGAVAYAESLVAPKLLDYAEVLKQENISQQQAIELQKAEMAEPWWAWAWRPGGMWLVGFLWLWSVVILHVLNAIFRIALPQPDLTILVTLSGLYMGLYMGGHTLKDFFQKKWGGKP